MDKKKVLIGIAAVVAGLVLRSAYKKAKKSLEEKKIETKKLVTIEDIRREVDIVADSLGSKVGEIYSGIDTKSTEEYMASLPEFESGICDLDVQSMLDKKHAIKTVILMTFAAEVSMHLNKKVDRWKLEDDKIAGQLLEEFSSLFKQLGRPDHRQLAEIEIANLGLKPVVPRSSQENLVVQKSLFSLMPKDVLKEQLMSLPEFRDGLPPGIDIDQLLEDFKNDLLSGRATLVDLNGPDGGHF